MKMNLTPLLERIWCFTENLDYKEYRGTKENSNLEEKLSQKQEPIYHSSNTDYDRIDDSDITNTLAYNFLKTYKF